MHSRPARAAVRLPIGQIAGHRTATPAVNTADRPGALPRPRVLTSDGCSGSSYLWWFSSQLFALHTGFATVGPSGMMTPAEWEAFARERPDVKLVPDSANSEYLSGENFPIHFMVNHTLPRTEWRFDAGFRMVKRTWDQVVVDHVFEGTDTLHTPTGRGKPLEERTVLRSPEAGPAACAPHSPAGNCTANAMVVKMLLYQMFQPGVGPALKALRPLLVHTYRRNWLGRLACRIKDITTHEMYGQPVYANGTRAFIYFERRSHPESPTFANLNLTSVRFGLTEAMKSGCGTEGLTGYPWYDSNRTVMTALAKTVGLELDDFPHLSEESLVAFEYEPEGSPGFVQSLTDWKTFMRAWGVEPDEAVILKAMRAQGIASRTRSVPRDTVYNWGEVDALLRELASSPDPKHCNWTWLGDAD